MDRKNPNARPVLPHAGQPAPASRSEAGGPRPDAAGDDVRRRKPLRLPFEKRRRNDWTVWIYRHRVGLLVTVVIYLLAAIIFMSYRIMLGPVDVYAKMFEMVDPEQEQPEELTPEQEEVLKEIERLEQMQYEQISNQISNQNAEFNAGLKDDKGTKAQEIYADAERVQREMNANRQAYEQGLADLETPSSSQRTEQSAKGDSEKKETSRVRGNVTVEYDLPGRTDRYLYIPAYECLEGGTVVVNITVDRNGKVLTADVSKATSTRENCIRDMAVKAARASYFDVSPTSPEKQKGTITYRFVPQ